MVTYSLQNKQLIGSLDAACCLSLSTPLNVTPSSVHGANFSLEFSSVVQLDQMVHCISLVVSSHDSKYDLNNAHPGFQNGRFTNTFSSNKQPSQTKNKWDDVCAFF